MVHQKTTIFAWETLEFKFRERKTDWYWWVGILAAGAIALVIWWGNYLFAFFILLAAIMIIWQSRRKPGTVHIEISELGIKIGETLLSYENIDAFWITDIRGDHPHLLLHTTKTMLPVEPIEIDEEVLDILMLREFLLDRIVESELTENIVQKTMYRMGL